jgi:hypothetical protein
MAAYAVTDVTTASDRIEAVMAGLETLMEAIDDAKTIYYIDIIELKDQGKYQGVIIHQA